MSRRGGGEQTTSMPRSEPTVVRTDLLALPVPPGDPAASVAAVLDLVHLGELVPDPASVSALRAHEGDEMQGAQVDLQEFLQVVWLHCYLRAPGAIALLKVQPEGDRDKATQEQNGGVDFSLSRLS